MKSLQDWLKTLNTREAIATWRAERKAQELAEEAEALEALRNPKPDPIAALVDEIEGLLTDAAKAHHLEAPCLIYTARDYLYRLKAELDL